MSEFIHMKEKMSFFYTEKTGIFMRKHFPWKALAQRTPLLISGPLFLPSFLHLVNIQQVFID